MNKRIQLKKEEKERTMAENIPTLSHDENIMYIRNYFVENINLDKDISKKLDQNIKKKQESYRQQDIKKKKFNCENFITTEQIYEKLLVSNLKCYYCLCNTTLFYKKIRQGDQWTLERIDNNIGHSYDNIVISCLDCNLKRRTKNSTDFQFAKQLVIKKV